MNIKNKRVLVTGAGGFIGSHLCEALVRQGASVHAFLRYTSQPSAANLEWLDPVVQRDIHVIRGDLRDELSVRRAMRRIDTVFHLGALISIPYSYQSPTEFVATNVTGTANVLAAALAEGVSRMVHTSTSEVFGTGQYLPMDERHPQHTQSPYAASKVGADKLAESYYLTFGLPVTIVRPFNTFGPRQSARAIIPTIITQALADDQVTIGALTPKRDLTFVQDTVEAFIRAALAPKAAGEFMNIGTGRMWSVGDMIQHVGKILGKKIRIQSVPERVRPRHSEVLRLRCDPRKAKRLLGWSAKTSFDDGLRQTIEWISAHADQFRTEAYQI